METNFNLKPLNTLQVECQAKHFKEVRSTYQLLHLLETPEWKERKHRILGGGSNTLFTSDFFDGFVIKIDITGYKILNEMNNDILIQVGAGEDRSDFINLCIEKQRGGVENLIGIPGKVGTSAVSNIGAYGQEASEVIHEVIGVNLETSTIQKLSNEECEFGYRKSIFKGELQGKFIITHIVFKLKKINENYDFTTKYTDIENYFKDNGVNFSELSPAEKLTTLTKTIQTIRTNKLPDHTRIGTAGSYFKNPEISLPQREKLKSEYPELKGFLQANETMKLAAGQLIELCGLKGYKEGNIKISDKHALIIINDGGTGEEIVAFANKIQSKVKDKFGILLEPEVMYCK